MDRVKSQHGFVGQFAAVTVDFDDKNHENRLNSINQRTLSGSSMGARFWRFRAQLNLDGQARDS